MTKIIIGTLIPPQMAEQVYAAVKAGNYVNKSDFLRQAIREKLERDKQ